MSTDYIINLIIWLSGFFFLFRIPVCKKSRSDSPVRPSLSIIIPARNEEHNLARLLKSLKGQLRANDTVTVVDDNSTDNTSLKAEQAGAQVIKSGPLPAGWTGKTWACHQGANIASGELLVFLDADTALDDKALDRLTYACRESNSVISVQPYHKMRSLYEQLSAFFNLILMAGMGAFSMAGSLLKPIGLFGPVILIRKALYLKSGGFGEVKGDILEDLALGRQFKNQGINLRCYGGRGNVSFRMYPEGISQLINGFSKGFAQGAMKTSIPVLIIIIAWISGASGTVRNLVEGLVVNDPSMILSWSLIYIFYAIQIHWMLYRIGNYQFYTSLLFPFPLLFFIIVFIYSFINIFIRRRVSWKGRQVQIGNKSG